MIVGKECTSQQLNLKEYHIEDILLGDHEKIVEIQGLHALPTPKKKGDLLIMLTSHLKEMVNKLPVKVLI